MVKEYIKNLKQSVKVLQEIQELINCGAFVDMRHEDEQEEAFSEGDMDKSIETVNKFINSYIKDIERSK